MNDPELSAALGALPVVIVEGDAPAAGHAQARRRRSEGDRFALMLQFDDRRALAAQQVAYQALPGRDRGGARSLLELIANGTLGVNDRRLIDIAQLDDAFVTLARECVSVCNLLVVRSFSEYAAYRETFGADAEIERWIPPRALGDWSHLGQRDRQIVVFAADRPAEAAALFIGALEPMQVEILVVADGGTPPSARARYVERSDPAWHDAIARADCVVDATISDPSWTHALAARGVPLAYATTTHAHEWVRNAAAYVPWSYRSIFAAVGEAIALGPAAVREPLVDVAAIAKALGG